MNQKQYLEKRILFLLNEAEMLSPSLFNFQIKSSEFKIANNDIPDWIIDGENEFVEPFQKIVNELYQSIVCYLDYLNLYQYLKLFYKTFGHCLNEEKVMNVTISPDGDYYSTYILEARRFLAVFEFSQSHNLSGIYYLETILKNTSKIISDITKNEGIKPKPTSESEVYKYVRLVLEAIFPSSINPKSNFFKTAKTYKPDILIPELGSAVEYKYAQNEEKLKSTIEQIASDAKGYTGDSDYYRFYAVFYVTGDFWGIEKFNKIWNDQEFPKNWKGYYIVGE